MMTVAEELKKRYPEKLTDAIVNKLTGDDGVKELKKRYKDEERVYLQTKSRLDELQKVKGDASRKLEIHYKELMTIEVGKLSEWVMMKVQLVETINAIDSLVPLARERLEMSEKSYIQTRLRLIQMGVKD
jgi:hypothetical protein